MAIAGMNGQWLGGRSLRTNWATGKGGSTGQRTQTSMSSRRYVVFIISHCRRLTVNKEHDVRGCWVTATLCCRRRRSGGFNGRKDLCRVKPVSTSLVLKVYSKVFMLSSILLGNAYLCYSIKIFTKPTVLHCQNTTISFRFDRKTLVSK